MAAVMDGERQRAAPLHFGLRNRDRRHFPGRRRSDVCSILARSDRRVHLIGEGLRFAFLGYCNTSDVLVSAIGRDLESRLECGED